MTAPIASGEGQPQAVEVCGNCGRAYDKHYGTGGTQGTGAWCTFDENDQRGFFPAISRVAASPVSAPVSAQCRLCEVTMDVGEATTFTICSTCFEKRRAPDPASAEKSILKYPSDYWARHPEFIRREVEKLESRLASSDRRVGELEQENERLTAALRMLDHGLRRRAFQLGDIRMSYTSEALDDLYPVGWEAWIPPEDSEYVIAGASFVDAILTAHAAFRALPRCQCGHEWQSHYHRSSDDGDGCYGILGSTAGRQTSCDCEGFERAALGTPEEKDHATKA